MKVSASLPYQILFGLCVGVTYLDNYELTFFVWSLAFLLSVKQRYSLTILKYLLCFAAIFLIAFVSAFFRDFLMYNYIRDVTYLLKPILGLLVGYQLCRSRNIKPFHTIVYTGLAIAIIHLLILFGSAVQYRIMNIHVLRQFGGYFSDFEIYALIILLFNKEFDLVLSKKSKRLLLLTIGISSLLYLSRTNFIQLGVFYIAMKGYFRFTRKSVITISTMVFLMAIAYTIIYNMHLTRDGKGIEAFLYKIKNAPIEAFKTKIDQDDYEDFNDNYRSFENIITVKQVSDEGLAAVLFGKGMGATVDVGREMWTNDGSFIRYVPTLHNGFMTVFLKSGLFGLFFSIWFIVMLCRQKKSEIPLVRSINLLLVGTGIFLLLANWVLLGLYLKIDNKSILIGFLLAYSEFLRKDKTTTDVSQSA